MPENDDHQGVSRVLSEQDRRLVGLLDDLPLDPTPWQRVAEHIGCSQGELLDTLNRWFDAGYVRRVLALFNSRALGYESTLVGTAVSADEADDVAAIIAALPMVSHNFLREGMELNLWFTLTCPIAGRRLDQVLEDLTARLGRPLRRFDTTRHYKISFRSLFDTGDEPAWPAPAVPDALPQPVLLKAITLLQDDLPRTERPFETLARKTDLTESQLIEAAAFLKHHNVIRRIGALLNLTKVTANRNVMCVWDVPDDRVDAFGKRAAEHERISHCYRRNTYPDWPWKIYTVIHGRDRDDCLRVIDELAESADGGRHLTLWTVKEYKQTPVRYNPDEMTLKL